MDDYKCNGTGALGHKKGLFFLEGLEKSPKSKGYLDWVLIYE